MFPPFKWNIRKTQRCGILRNDGRVVKADRARFYTGMDALLGVISTKTSTRKNACDLDWIRYFAKTDTRHLLYLRTDTGACPYDDL